MSETVRKPTDIFYNRVAAVFTVLLFLWTGFQQANQNHYVDFFVYGVLALLAIPVIQEGMWKRWGQPKWLVWIARIIYGLLALVAVVSILAEYTAVGLVMLILLFVFALVLTGVGKLIRVIGS